MKTRFPTYYGAKFAREGLNRPIDWLIFPNGGWFELRRIGGF